MNLWLTGAAVMFALLLPAGLISLRGDAFERLLGLELSSTIAPSALLLFAEGSNRDVYFDVALVLAVMTFAGTLVFIRFLEHWV